MSRLSERARYVLVLDDDTLVAKGTLEGKDRFMDEHPQVGMSGCETRNADGSYQRSFGLVPSLRTEFATALGPEGFWPESLYRDVSKLRDVEWLKGSFMLAGQRKGGCDVVYMNEIPTLFAIAENRDRSTVEQLRDKYRHHTDIGTEGLAGAVSVEQPQHRAGQSCFGAHQMHETFGGKFGYAIGRRRQCGVGLINRLWRRTVRVDSHR